MPSYMLRIGAAEFVFRRPAYKQPLDSGAPTGQPPQKRARLIQEADAEAGKTFMYINVFEQPNKGFKRPSNTNKLDKR
jgi:hypothetical protein